MKKKILLALLLITTAFALACGFSQSKPKTDIPPGSMKGKKVLVAYFSRTGHTKEVALTIAQRTGGEVFTIRPLVAYPDNMISTAIVARQEKNDHFLPPMADTLSDISKYDVIFIGYPIWWSDAPMIIHSFIKSQSFAGKTIIPYATSMMSGIEESQRTLEELAPEAHFLPGFTASSDPEELKKQVAAYGF